MKAWQLHRPAAATGEPLGLAEVPEPEPGPGEIRLRVRACGVCLTDVHTVEGDLIPPAYPVVPGHQVVGIVDAVGPGVEGVRPGERRGAFWLHRACGRCPACRRGDENLCPDAAFTGLHVPGGYAEAMVVPAAYTVPIPAAFSDAEAAPLLCAGIIGYRALRLSGLQPGERLALFGFGSSAHLVIQVARHQGCEVVVYTRSEGHRRLARELGPSGVRVNAIAPGLVESGITRRHYVEADGTVDEARRTAFLGRMAQMAPLQMVGEPDVIGYAALYLASDAARFVTGQVLRPNGGVAMP
ncbi:MAG: SDR family oxidoreductase [Symbiobacteriaceae bacterium]